MRSFKREVAEFTQTLSYYTHIDGINIVNTYAVEFAPYSRIEAPLAEPINMGNGGFLKKASNNLRIEGSWL